MKILVAYDGSPYSDLMLEELKYAGLPAEADVTVLSVAERWFPKLSTDLSQEEAESAYRAASAIGQKASLRLRSDFPSWTVREDVAVGSPAECIMEHACTIEPELIVLGALGHTALERIFIGSVSYKVANEATCSVRVSRRNVIGRRERVRIVIGYDGMPGSDAAVQAVADRPWPDSTSVRLVTTVGFGYSPVSNLILTEDHERARQIHGPAVATLHDAGLNVSTVIAEDDPKVRIVKEASDFAADAIFIGHNDHRLAYRLFLGTVATAVLTRAACSVEIVRARASDRSALSGAV